MPSSAVLARQFVKSLVGFRAAVAEKNFAACADHFFETRGEEGLRAGEKKIRGVDQFAGLLRDRLLQRGMGMADRVDRDARGEIEVFASVFIPNARALAARQTERKPPVGRNDMAGVEFGRGRLFGRHGSQECWRRTIKASRP